MTAVHWVPAWAAAPSAAAPALVAPLAQSMQPRVDLQARLVRASVGIAGSDQDEADRKGLFGGNQTATNTGGAGSGTSGANGGGTGSTPRVLRLALAQVVP